MIDSIISEKYLPEDSCARMTSHVLASQRLKDSITRQEEVFRLGGAYYWNTENYSKQIGEWRKEMEPFESDLESLRQWLEKRLSVKISFHPNLAPPGFHIFYDSKPEGSRIHTDGRVLDAASLIEPNLRFSKLLSAVVSVNSPKQRGGLHFWEKNITAFAKEWGALHNPPPPPDLVVPMPVGQIVIFNSLLIHQVEAFQINDISESRITLVGHLGEIRPAEFVFFW